MLRSLTLLLLYFILSVSSLRRNSHHSLNSNPIEVQPDGPVVLSSVSQDHHKVVYKLKGSSDDKQGFGIATLNQEIQGFIELHVCKEKFICGVAQKKHTSEYLSLVAIIVNSKVIGYGLNQDLQTVAKFEIDNKDDDGFHYGTMELDTSEPKPFLFIEFDQRIHKGILFFKFGDDEHREVIADLVGAWANENDYELRITQRKGAVVKIGQCPLKLSGGPDKAKATHDFFGYQDCHNNGLATTKEAHLRGQIVGENNGKQIYAVKQLWVH